ncbi:hypothetical protein Vadar_019485 [Vaccinium darrowii]|uniref:Uncharacterized protein n=1 Tax=Vaccinium darrowii TaxID=229202 RepID=A0ACB7XT97_9ERIC|nr:hypothetical protein Vadar_019485 [Vaccinium darrowii]
MVKSCSGVGSKKVWKRPSESRVGYRFWVSDKAKQKFESYHLKGTDLIERDVHINGLDFIGVLTQFRQRGWLTVCSGNVPARPILVKEFFANVTGVDVENQSFTTRVRGVDLEFSIETVCNLTGLPIVQHPQWPLSPDLLPRASEVQRELTGGVYTKLPKIKQGDLAPHYRLLNKIVCALIDPSDNISHVYSDRSMLLYGIGRGYSFDLATKIWEDVYQYTHHPPETAALPYISLLTRFMLLNNVPIISGEPTTALKAPATRLTLKHSTAHVYKSAYMPRHIPLPKYPHVEPAYPAIFAPADHIPVWLQPDPPTESVIPPSATTPTPSTPIAQPPNDLMAFLLKQFELVNGRLDGFALRLEGFTFRLDALASNLISLSQAVVAGNKYPGEANAASEDAGEESENDTEESEDEDDDGSETADCDMSDDA